MPKKHASTASAGTTVNPEPQPVTQPVAAPAAPAARTQAKGKPTAGPAPAVPATNEDHGAAAFSELVEALNIGSTPAKPATQAPPQPRAAADMHAIPPEDEDDETPAASSAVPEDSENTGEETGSEDIAAGDNLSPEPNDSEETEAPADEASPNAPTNAEQDDFLRMEEEALDALATQKRWPKSVLRRIKGMRKHLETIESSTRTEIETLRAENEQLKSQKPGDAPPAPITDAETQLTSRISNIEQTLDFIDDNPAGATTPDGKEWTAEQLRKERRNYERQLRNAEDDLRELQKARKTRAAQVEQALPVEHPALRDRTSAQALHVDALLRDYPVLKSDPFFKLLVADSVAWRLSRQKAAATNGTHSNGQANGNGAATRPAAPSAKPAPRPNGVAPGRPAALPQATNGRRAQIGALESRFMETGDPDAGKALIASVLMPGR